MQKKIPILLVMLIIGSMSLVLSLTLSLPNEIEWALLIIGALLNITSSVGLMIIGAKRTRES
ncbi:hypothetical protein MHZ92_20480 [Sporosarcina sp. ACRSL]|uniref:hypothetical protein n=1 Tax=Sporosarcina sp. ACRSL TaxID=2918215 RepID=UPI001EF5F919|nr:hypothetical protein [Sporosarcina sp. ACRSL]MCG7346485.1 hypothetical protein [Sporosarcina sp. ACRSL]